MNLNKLPNDKTETYEKINELARYQLKHIHEMTDPKDTIEGRYHHEWSDDGHDYITGALNLGRDLIDLLIENEDVAKAKLEAMLDPKNEAEFIHNRCACDGVANEITDYIEKLHPGWEDI